MGINCILNFFKIFIRTKVSLFEHICLFVCNTRLGEFLSLPIAVDTSGSFFVCNKQRNFWSNWYFGGIQNAVYPHFELMNILKKWLRKRHYLTSNLEKNSWHVIMSPTLIWFTLYVVIEIYKLNDDTNCLVLDESFYKIWMITTAYQM